MKKSVSLFLVSLLFVSVLSVSFVSANFLGNWFGKATGDAITGNAVSVSDTPTIKTCTQTIRTFTRRTIGENQCGNDETKKVTRSLYRSCSGRFYARTCRNYQDYSCIKTTTTDCSLSSACPTGATERKSESCTITTSSNSPAQTINIMVLERDIRILNLIQVYISSSTNYLEDRVVFKDIKTGNILNAVMVSRGHGIITLSGTNLNINYYNTVTDGPHVDLYSPVRGEVISPEGNGVSSLQIMFYSGKIGDLFPAIIRFY